MFEALEAGMGLDFILWLQQNRTGWMETLSQILDQLGYDLGYVALFGFIFWAVSKRHGVRLIFALVTIALVTFVLKDLLARPRPFEAYPDLITPVFDANGFGLPSGHTTLAVMIWGYLGIWLRKGWVWALVILYIALQSWGRMVSGVHFPHDVALGLLVGAVTLALYYPLATQWERLWEAQKYSAQMAIVIAVPVGIALVVMVAPLQAEQAEAYLTVLGLALGAGIGVVIEPRTLNFTPHPNWVQRFVHFVIGAVLVVAILFGLSPLFDNIAETGTIAYLLRVVRYSIAGYVAIMIVPYLGVKLKLMHSERPTTTETVPVT
ncbi:MAG: phosphatase PAP2 family protein [Anaerolineae bacterium]